MVTPLLQAADKGHLQVAKAVIAAGAKVDLAKAVSLFRTVTPRLSQIRATSYWYFCTCMESLGLHMKIWI